MPSVVNALVGPLVLVPLEVIAGIQVNQGVSTHQLLRKLVSRLCQALLPSIITREQFDCSFKLFYASERLLVFLDRPGDQLLLDLSFYLVSYYLWNETSLL